MKILILDEEFPYPLNSGKNIRNYNLAVFLAKKNDVSYMAYGKSGSDGFLSLRNSGVNAIAVKPRNRSQSGIGFYLKLLVNLFSDLPYIVSSHYTDEFQKAVCRAVRNEEFDLLICQWTPYAIFVKEIKEIKRVIITQNIETAIWRRYRENERNPLKRWYMAVQEKKVGRFERDCFTWVDGASAVSSQEANQLQEISPGYPVGIIENGVDISYFRPIDDKIDPNMVLFTGSMDWRPNQDAALYFAHEIFPILREKNPLIKAVLVGRYPPAKIINLSKIKGITVTGTVDDIRPYLSRSALFIVPLRIGGGSRLKIIEAMAMKKAVVSTTIGAEGLAVKDGENIVMADTPGDFAAACLRLLDDTEFSSRIADNGFNLARGRYDWEIIGQKLHEYLIGIMEK